MKTPAAAVTFTALTLILPAASQTAVDNSEIERRRSERVLTQLRDSAASLLRSLPSAGAALPADRLQPSRALAGRARSRQRNGGDLARLEPILPLTMAARGEPPDMERIEEFLQTVDQAEALDRQADVLNNACAARLSSFAECIFGKLELAAERAQPAELAWRNFKAVRRHGQWIVLPVSGGELRVPSGWRLKNATPQGLVFERRLGSSDVIQIEDADMGWVFYTDSLGRGIDPDTGDFASPNKDLLTSLSRQEPLRGWPVY